VGIAGQHRGIAQQGVEAQRHELLETQRHGQLSFNDAPLTRAEAILLSLIHTDFDQDSDRRRDRGGKKQ
jgi:hypothetical protein